MKRIRAFCFAVTLATALAAVCSRAQEIPLAAAQRQQSAPSEQPAATQDASLPDSPTPQNSTPTNDSSSQIGLQPKRILGIIPNYRAVSANTHLPPLDVKQKFWLATQDTFDYSDFIFVGGLAAFSYFQDSEPTFGRGGAAYGRYYWRIFVDGAVENYMTEAIVPSLTKEDPRYYTLGHGGFLKRTGYAVTRLLITRTDSGKATFNISEIAGAGAAAGIGALYYPRQGDTFVKTYQRWGTEVALDGAFNVMKEFWPDIDRAVFHGKY